MELRINSTLHEVSEVGDLRERLALVGRSQFAEVWMRPNTDWPAICALINGEAAWLMFMRCEGDAGLSTRNGTYAGPRQAVIEYHLSNGQRDEYPASWNITTGEALRALEYFLTEATMAPWLEWSEGQR